MSESQHSEVDVRQWRAAHEDARGRGFMRCEWVTAYDRDGIGLVSHLTADDGSLSVITARLDGQAAESVAEVFPSAAFHEREVAQMFGVTFTGHPDPRPAFVIDVEGYPLRRDFPLRPRINTVWPGAHDPDESVRRRPTLAPGVLKEWTS